MSDVKSIVTSMNAKDEYSRWFFQNHMRILATGEETGGEYFMAELRAPVGDEPPLHTHLNEEEAFYVLEGQMTVWVGDEDPIVLNPGDFALLPRDIPHIYRVTSSTEARWIALLSPAGFEVFVNEVSVPAEEPILPPKMEPPSEERMKEIVEIGAKYGVQILAPPGARPADLKQE